MKKLTNIGMLAIASITFGSCGGEYTKGENKEGSDTTHETTDETTGS